MKKLPKDFIKALDAGGLQYDKKNFFKLPKQKLFEVHVLEGTIKAYTVEAKNKKEAQEKVLNGDRDKIPSFKTECDSVVKFVFEGKPENLATNTEKEKEQEDSTKNMTGNLVLSWMFKTKDKAKVLCWLRDKPVLCSFGQTNEHTEEDDQFSGFEASDGKVTFGDLKIKGVNYCKMVFTAPLAPHKQSIDVGYKPWFSPVLLAEEVNNGKGVETYDLNGKELKGECFDF